MRVLLAANGFNVAKAMSVIDQWIENYGREAMARLEHDGLAPMALGMSRPGWLMITGRSQGSVRSYTEPTPSWSRRRFP